MKICSLCGKNEASHWARHWAKRHPGKKPTELNRDIEWRLDQGYPCRYQKHDVEKYWWEHKYYDPYHRSQIDFVRYMPMIDHIEQQLMKGIKIPE